MTQQRTTTTRPASAGPAPVNTAIAQRQNAQQSKFQEMRRMLEAAKPQLALVLQREMDPDRMVRFVLTALTKTPKLLECTKESIGLALMTASQMGIEPNGRDGHLVPFKDQCQFIPDYKGLVKLAYKNPKVLSVQAHAVREHDFFEYEFGSNAHLSHKPAEGDDRGELTHAWAMVKLKDGQETFVVMVKSEVLKRQNFSKSKDSADSPWKNWPDEMWAKTAVKSVSKFCPLGKEFERANEMDTALERGDDPLLTADMLNLDAPDLPGTKSDQLADRMGAGTSTNEHQKTVVSTGKPAAEPAVNETAPSVNQTAGQAGETAPAVNNSQAQSSDDDEDDGLVPSAFYDRLVACLTVDAVKDALAEFTGPGSDLEPGQREAMEEKAAERRLAIRAAKKGGR